MPTVQDILARKGSDVISVKPGETVLKAAELMSERGIGGLVVTEGGRLVGIFTERDILRRVVAQRRDPAATKVADVMTTPVTACAPDTRVDECAAMMTGKRIPRLPGVRAAGDYRLHAPLHVRFAVDTLAQPSSHHTISATLKGMHRAPRPRVNPRLDTCH